VPDSTDGGIEGNADADISRIIEGADAEAYGGHTGNEGQQYYETAGVGIG